MSNSFKAGDKVICIFTITTDDRSRRGYARRGVVAETPKKNEGVLVDFGKGFRGHTGGILPLWHHRWYVDEKELGLYGRQRKARS